MKPSDRSRSCRISVKFLCAYSKRYIGIPFYCWINRYDTFQFVIDTYMKRSQKYLQYAFIMKKGNKKRKSIPKARWSEYSLMQNMDLKEDVLLLKFGKLDRANGVYVEFGHGIHRMLN